MRDAVLEVCTTARLDHSFAALSRAADLLSAHKNALCACPSCLFVLCLFYFVENQYSTITRRVY